MNFPVSKTPAFDCKSDECPKVYSSHFYAVSATIKVQKMAEGRRSGLGGNYEKSIYNQLMEVMGRLDAVEKDLRVEKTEHKEDVERLNTRIDELRSENQLLRDDNARLKSIINNDSSNTSNPPSTDQKAGKAANTYNGRQKTGRRAGGQKGHKGTTLTKADVEEKLRSGKCRHQIREIGTAAGGKYVTKYEIDLDVAPLITEVRIYADERGCFRIPSEYRSDVVYGPNLKAMAVALYSEGVMANDRIASFLDAVGGNALGMSSGSVYHFCKSFSEKAQGSVAHLEEDLLNRRVVMTDATVVAINGKQGYIRNFSMEKSVLYRAMKDKSLTTMRKLRFLAKYTGILVHDHETSLYHFGTGHGECNVHIIRYLRKNSEDSGNSWSGEMKSLLCEMNRERKQSISKGEKTFPKGLIKEYEERYCGLIARGREENKETKYKYAREDEKKLLNRMEKYMDNHLLFLHDFEVPFDDNMSERDLRKAKNRQKMAGGFRKESGHEMYCNILTIIETLKRRNMPILENIKKLFMGTPAIF